MAHVNCYPGRIIARVHSSGTRKPYSLAGAWKAPFLRFHVVLTSPFSLAVLFCIFFLHSYPLAVLYILYITLSTTFIPKRRPGLARTMSRSGVAFWSLPEFTSHREITNGANGLIKQRRDYTQRKLSANIRNGYSNILKGHIQRTCWTGINEHVGGAHQTHCESTFTKGLLMRTPIKSESSHSTPTSSISRIPYRIAAFKGIC